MTTRILLMVSLATLSSLRAEFNFSSGPAQTHLLELYTSEGCSSCPPAESWLSRQKENSRLWRDFVPIAFHVDYWNNLGWADRFASPELTARQRSLSASWGSTTVYTPGFVLDGSEWRRAEPPAAQAEGGLLQVRAESGMLEVKYAAPDSAPGPWEVHAAALLMDQKIRVRAGENQGRELEHDFIATKIVSAPLDSEGQARLALPLIKGQACAVWITAKGELRPRQAAGGWWR